MSVSVLYCNVAAEVVMEVLVTEVTHNVCVCYGGPSYRGNS